MRKSNITLECRRNKCFFALLLICIHICSVHAQPTSFALSQTIEHEHVPVPAFYASAGLMYPSLVTDFYKLNKSKPFWYANTQSIVLRRKLLNMVDSAAYIGLDANKYHYKELQSGVNYNAVAPDSSLNDYEKIYTDAAIALMKDMYQGYNIRNMIGYDEISIKYKEQDNQFICTKLLSASTAAALQQAVEALQPSDLLYNRLKNELQIQLQKKASDTLLQLTSALNILRWIHHFRFQQYIIVSVASASLDYYQNGKNVLAMKVVVGKASTQTPRFAAYCNQVILYPYWNVPASIALNELFPKFRKNPALVNEMNMQILDDNGKILNPFNVSWSAYSRYNFPYRFRQSTGCDNALGVIKFNLTDPFSVYMHDTNNKDAFLSSSRYYSHGCIRLEKPLDLANYLLSNEIDSAYLQSCLKDQQPVVLNVKEPVPVFVIYSTVQVNELDKVVYSKDVYHLFKKY